MGTYTFDNTCTAVTMGTSSSSYSSLYHTDVTNGPDLNSCDVYNYGRQPIKVKPVVFIPDYLNEDESMLASLSDQCLPKFSFVPYSGWHFYNGSVTPYESEDWLQGSDLHPVLLIHGALSPPLQLDQLNMIEEDWRSPISDQECYWWTRRIAHLNSDLSCRIWCHKSYKEISETQLQNFGVEFWPSQYLTCSWDLLARLCVSTIHNEEKPCPIVLSNNYKYIRTELYGRVFEDVPQKCELNLSLTPEQIKDIITEYRGLLYDPCQHLIGPQCLSIVLEEGISLCQFVTSNTTDNDKVQAAIRSSDAPLNIKSASEIVSNNVGREPILGERGSTRDYTDDIR